MGSHFCETIWDLRTRSIYVAETTVGIDAWGNISKAVIDIQRVPRVAVSINGFCEIAS